MPYTLTITDGGAYVARCQWANKDFSSGKTGYFANGRINLCLKSPTFTITDSDGETVLTVSPEAREGKRSNMWFAGGPEWQWADEGGSYAIQCQVVTQKDIWLHDKPNRHTWQLMAYSAA